MDFPWHNSRCCTYLRMLCNSIGTKPQETEYLSDAVNASQGDGNMYVADILEYKTHSSLSIGGMNLFACIM